MFKDMVLYVDPMMFGVNPDRKKKRSLVNT